MKDFLQSRGDSDSGNDPIDIPDSVGHFFESLVGLFMIGLGVYGLRSAFRKQRELQGVIPIDPTEEETPEVEQTILADEEDVEESRYRDAVSGQGHNIATRAPSSHENVLQEGTQDSLEMEHYHGYQSSKSGDEPPSNVIVRWTRLVSLKTLALCAGIVHGLAGPGGVLGIVPAVQLHDWKLASCYLGSFCISSTLTMGVFACTYGTVSSFLGHKNNWEFQVQCFSAILSLAVGVTWLVLLSLGKLEDVFP